jgi:hypothetical protein
MNTLEDWSYDGSRRANLDDASCCVLQLQWLLALLRAQYWSYQNSHWEAVGDSSYESHLLFQRIYAGDDSEGEGDDGIQGEVDQLAEKMVGTFGPEAVDQKVLLKMSAYWIGRWCQVGCLHERGLLSEDDAHQVIKDTYHRLKNMGRLTLGMDDFLMSLDSEHETNEYLLRQMLRRKQASQAWAEMARKLEE